MGQARVESWTTDGSRFYRRSRTPVSLRAGIAMGTKLTRSMVGTYDGTVFSVVTSNITYSTPNVTISNTRFEAVVIVSAANVKFVNCKFIGPAAYPSGDQFLVVATSGSVSGLEFTDCEFDPQTPHWNQDSGIAGHDYKATRCYFRRTTDGLNIYNTAASKPYAANVELIQCLIDPLGWWTASSTGVVHPSDKVTHNDGIQIQGGTDIKIWGCTILGSYEPNYGHIKLLSGVPSDEYWNLAMAGSQASSGPSPAGWPFVNPPDRALAVPSMTTGTRSTGRYNGGSSDSRVGVSPGLGSNSAILLSPNVGPIWNIDFQYNNLGGGYYTVNIGGCEYGKDTAGTSYAGAPSGIGAIVKNNKFERDPYDQRDGTGHPATIVFHSSWAGHVDAGVGTSAANVYADGSGEILVRGI